MAGEGLFAITGPTGSGKSTILDAITLALYGRAARYRSRPSPPDMITRGCWEASAEVEFQVERSKKYRACWYLYRARKKADGVPQQPKRYIYDENGVEIASKTRECDELIVELTGLTSERFFRSAMLAQGDFARFLQADERERADLLESLTNTEIYSELGIAAFRKYADAKEELNRRRVSLESVPLMSEGLKSEKLQLRDSLSSSMIQLRSELSAKEKRLQTLERSQQIKSECETLAALRSDLQTQQLAFANELQRLKDHQAAMAFRNDLNLVELSSDQYRHRNHSLRSATEACNQARNNLGCASTHVRAWSEYELGSLAAQMYALENERSGLETQQQTFEAWLQNHQHYESLAHRIIEFRRVATQLTLTRQSLDFCNDSISQTKSDLCTKDGRLIGVQQEIQRLRLAIDDNLAADKVFGEKLQSLSHAGMETPIDSLIQTVSQSISKLQSLLRYEQDLTQLEESIALLTGELSQYQRKTNELQRAVEAVDAQVQMSGELIDALMKSQLQAERIKSLEEQRHGLESDQPCPLCGSLEHPYLSDGSICTELSETEGKLEKAKRDHQHFLQAQRNDYQAFVDNDAAQKNCQTQIDSLRVRSLELVESIYSLSEKSSRISIESIDHSLSAQMLELDALQAKKAEIQLVLLQRHDGEIQRGLLQSRLDIMVAQSEETNREIESSREALCLQEHQYQQEQSHYIELLNDFGQSIAPWHSKIVDEPLDSVLDQLDQLVTAFQYHRDEHSRTISQIQAFHQATLSSHAQREKLLALKEYAARLVELVGDDGMSEAEFDAQKVSATSDAFAILLDMENSWKNSKAIEAAAQAAAQSAADQLTQANKVLLTRLMSTQFHHVDALKQAYLSNEEFERIQTRSNYFEQERARIESVFNSRTSEMESLAIEPGATTEQCDALKLEVEALRHTLEQNARELGMVEQQLAQDMANRELIAEGHEQILEDERSLETSRILSELIGSADGKKFRAFTQGLMLGYLIQKANRHLSRFNDRYALIRGTESELSLEICDQHQANVTRPLASLSGGESFLVSLALALGLSDLSGAKVEIDSLFIDEGFGTLDADSLDIAISALETLRGENKMIGIISHVESLKERISTQVRVERQVNGRSQIKIAATLK